MNETINNTLYGRRCPRCGVVIQYSSYEFCMEAFNLEILCVDCSAPRKPGGQPKRQKARKKYVHADYKVVVSDTDENFLAVTADGLKSARTCPSCNEKVFHRSTKHSSAENAARTAIKSKKLCQSCKMKKRTEEGSNKFVPGNKLFLGQHHSDETKKKMCAIMTEKWKMFGPDWHKPVEPGSSSDCGCFPITPQS